MPKVKIDRFDISIDIWDDNGCIAECIESIPKGRSLMLKYHKEGRPSVRMYVCYSNDETKNLYYSFVDGKIKKESNYLGN